MKPAPREDKTIRHFLLLRCFDGILTPISTSVPTLGAATCWNAVTPNGKWVYTFNAGTSTISGFSIASNGALTALPGTILGTNPAGATNLDIAITTDGKFLYSLDGEIGAISTFGVQPDGTLINLGTAGALPKSVGFNGIAANYPRYVSCGNHPQLTFFSSYGLGTDHVRNGLPRAPRGRVSQEVD